VAPRHSNTVRWFWDRYLQWKYQKSFASIHFNLTAAIGRLDPQLPVILVPNHISWWDGFFCFEVQRGIRPGSGIFSLMLESELKKFPILRKIGCFGIEPGNPFSVRRAFEQFRDLVAVNPYRTLTFFPQGEISPLRRRPLGFQRGIETLTRMTGRVQYVPVAIHIEPLNHEKPTAFVYAGAPIDSFATNVTCKMLEAEVIQLLDQVSLTAPLALLAGGS
jgi:1-acyl-sn-glycerol-3-phosphate acyltransferase